MYFRNYGLRKTWFYKCLKSRASEDPSTSNMVSGPKHCLTSKFITHAFLFHFEFKIVDWCFGSYFLFSKYFLCSLFVASHL